MIAAGSDLGLTKESLAVTATLKQPLNIKVFVTSTCAFCPRAVGLAYRLAAASDYITASVILLILRSSKIIPRISEKISSNWGTENHY